jgi:hypothetical protein
MALFMMTFFAFSQNVPREMVILEIGTGTWCQYRPGAAMGADDLIANGHDVAVIEYHYNDPYENSYSLSRIGYYNISGYPTSNFDGGMTYVGGSQTQSLYPTYLSRVNQRLAVTSPFTLEVEGSHTCLQNFTANISVTKVGTNTSSNLKLHAVLTESHISVNWFSLHEVNFVCRKMMPNQNGTPLSFSGGNTQEVNLTFSLEPNWKAEKCELVVFVQDQTTREIFQATKISLMDFLPEYDFDAAVTGFVNLPQNNCSGLVQPTVTIRNLGAQPLNSLDILYYINEGESQSYSWSGALDYLSVEEVTLPPIAFVVEDENALVTECQLPNGNGDECVDNDVRTAIIDRSTYTPNTVKLALRTDSHPEETTWEILDAAGNLLYSGGPYSEPNKMFLETFELTGEECHSFVISDAGGDGFQDPGFYMLFYGTNTNISQGFDFGAEKVVEFNTDDPVGIDDPLRAGNEVTVYPNPFSGRTTFTFTLQSQADVSVRIFSLTGQQVDAIEAGTLQAGEHYLNMDASSLKPGMYIYKLQVGETVNTGKLIVK